MKQLEKKADMPSPQSNLESIALIGMSCKFPGDVASPEGFWQFLMNGGNGIVDVPADRWNIDAYYDKDPEKKNKMYVSQGGFIRDIDQFEPQFFGISPKEAPAIDPQHRWLLELTYEALENAGLRLSELRGSDTAVYVGQFMHDYEQLQTDSMAHELISSHSATGPSMTLTANRISYAFDFTGPSVALDTACSSSLVALDMACQAILRGDSALAIAAGVNILLRPEMTMSICKASMLSPDCRCKSFDASANGYVRSEGAGVVVVKKYSDALRDGDPILAVIRATGVNQDGQTKGITVPNGESQQKLLYKSLDRAGLKPEDIQYLEAHGTGTAVGDPIEINAMGSVLKSRHANDPACMFGSVKSNIGHTEAAAGMAGIIKTVLAMNAGIVPRNINFNQLNPAINLSRLNLQLATTNLPWIKKENTSRVAVVNSFGFGGTNANAILEQPTESNYLSVKSQNIPVKDEVKIYWLALSAKNENSLTALASHYVQFLENAVTVSLDDICFTAAVRRDHYHNRVVFSGKSREEIIEAINAFISKQPHYGWVSGNPVEVVNKGLVFVFSGMGTQWVGMGQELYQNHPLFKSAIDRCDAALKPLTGWSLVDKLYINPELELVNRTDISQPAIFAVQVALHELLKSWGIFPEMIVGHSAGEVAAAYLANALSFDDAIKVVYERSRLQYTTEGTGKMLAVGISKKELIPYIKQYESSVSIAAINDEDAITLAGDEKHLQKIFEDLDAKGLFAKFLNVNVPYHSSVMDRIKRPLVDSLEGINVLQPQCKLYSTVSGEITQTGDWGADYWADNVRNPVLFQAAIERMIADGAQCFVEISAAPALSNSIEKILNRKKIEGIAISCLKRNLNAELLIPNVIGNLYVKGIELPWKKIYAGSKHTILPNYQWQRSRYWSEAPSVEFSRLNNVSPDSGLEKEAHILLGRKISSSLFLWHKDISLDALDFLSDHRVEGEVVYPAAAYIDTGLAIANGMQADFPLKYTLEDLVFHKALFLTEKTSRLETNYDPVTGRYTISAIENSSGQWNKFSEGRVSPLLAPAIKTKIDVQEIINRLENKFLKEEFYRHCSNLGLNYLNRFQAVEQAWFSDDESIVKLELPPELLDKWQSHLLHPVILDGAFQSLFPTIDSGFLPTGIRQVRYHSRPGQSVYAHLITHFKNEKTIYGDIAIVDANGDVLVEVLGVSLKSTNATINSIDNFLYEFKWQQAALDNKSSVQGSYIVINNGSYECNKFCHFIINNPHFIVVDESIFLRKEHQFELSSYRDVCYGFVFFAKNSEDIFDNESSSIIGDHVLGCTLELLNIVKAITTIEWRNPLAFALISNNAQVVKDTDENVNVLQAPYWGFSRVFASEYSDISVKNIDVDGRHEDYSSLILDEIRSSSSDDEVAYRNGERYVNRLHYLTSSSLVAYANKSEPLSHRDDFIYSESDANFKKYINQEPITPSSIKINLNRAIPGGENQALSGVYLCLGNVSATGESVKTCKPGDSVIYMSHNLTSVSIVNENMMVPVAPEQDGGYLLQKTACLLKYFACFDGIQNTSSSRNLVLLGEPGIASEFLINFAKASGWTVNVCSFSKQSIEGVNWVDVNHYDWPDSCVKKESIDLLICFENSEFDLRILPGLKPFSRIVDWRNQLLDSHSLQLITSKNIRYQRMNGHDLLIYQMDKILYWIEKSIQFNNTYMEIDFPQVSLNDWIQDTYKNKPLVIDRSLDEHPIYVHHGLNAVNVLQNKTYLITGGLGGLGLTMMEWLVKQGARHIVLTGRSAPSVVAAKKIELAKNRGVMVHVVHTDIANYDQVFSLFNTVLNGMPPLGGVLHSAGVLDDGVISQQTEEKFLKVYSPKVTGTYNLHLLTQDLPLGWFICFSSIASVIGWVGQVNYSAANSFMDALCHYRRQKGLPGLSINWGPWAEAGMAANLDKRDIERMENAGMFPLSIDDGLKSINKLLQYPLAQAGVFNVDWKKLLHGSSVMLQKKSILKNFVSSENSEKIENFKDQLLNCDRDDRENLLQNKIKMLLAEVIGLSDSEQIQSKTNVFDYGINSLMAMDFKNRLQSIVSVPLPTTLVLKYPTVSAMALQVMEILSVEENDKNLTISNTASDNDINLKIKKSPETAFSPLSFPQKRLWLLDKIMNGSQHYHLVRLLKISGNLNIDAYKKSWNKIVDRHLSLRSNILFDNVQGVYQTIQSIDNFSIEFKSLPEIENPSTIDETIKNFINNPFNLETDFKIKILLVHIKENEYVSVSVIHHIAADGWSSRIILDEFTQCYSSYCDNKSPDLTDLAINYIDYSYWQNQLVARQEMTSGMEYWKQHLDAIPACHNIPVDFIRPAKQTINGARVFTTIDTKHIDKLKNICLAHDTTLFVGLFSIFSLLVGRYSNEKDIVIGTPVANRDHVDLSELVGFFVNTLALRIKLDDKIDFLQLLKEVKQSILSGFANQHVPFELIVDQIVPERNMSYTPIFQIMFALHNNRIGSLDLPAVEINEIDYQDIYAKYELELNCTESNAVLNLEWIYNTDLFDRSSIEGMAKNFEYLLFSLVENPQMDIYLAEIVNQQQLGIYSTMNQTTALFDSKKCLHHLFEEAVALYPEHTALIYENKSWSYSELNSYVNCVAHYLISEKGIQPDNLVGVCLDRSEDMVVAMLAVLKAGAAYIPIDPEYPFARVEYMVKDAQPICVMTTQTICQKLPFLHSYAVCFDDEPFQKTISCKPASNISPPHLSANNLAYVIYTSGSTGKPKGVMVEHGNIVNFLYSMKIRPGIKQQDTLLAVTSTSFDIHTLEIFLPLISGAKMIVADRNSVMDPNKLIALMDNHNVNLMQATPATWKMLLDVKWNPATEIKVLCGGEALSSKLAGELLSNSNIELWNMYGPTETTVWSLLQKIEKYSSISIGAPIANTQIYIVDQNLHVCPVGVVGELLIGGLGVARGYLNRPELTAEKFIPDHFSGTGFLYKTGDMVRYSSRGILEYIGRKDYQVKIRGFRIELEEIENALLSCNNLNVKDVLIIVKPITLQLVAFIVPIEEHFDDSQETQIIEQLRSHINSLLPSYMMPSAFVFIDEFPLTPNGKVDRNKLIEFNVIENESEYVEAETDIEKSIQKIWQDILNIEKISISSDFFHLGGDSLLAIKFIMLAAECGMPYSVQQVFESRTIKRLAASGFNKSIAEYKEYNGPVKLTVEQKHLLSRNLLPERFVIPFHVVTKIDKEILLQSLEFIINYHETLRLSFAKESGVWVSELREPKQNFSIVEIESAEFITYEMEGWLDEKMFQLMSEFNIESGPLIKVYIFRSPGSEEAVLSILIHHLVADGVSAQKIVADLLSVYQQISAGSVPRLLPKEISYKDTIDSLYRYAKSSAVISEKDYWLSLPWDAVGQIPLDYQYAEEANTYGSTYRVALSLTKDDTSVLSQELARKFEIPLHVALISAMASALGKLTQKQYVRFASVNARGVLNKALAGFDVTRITGWLSTKSHMVICNNDKLTSLDRLDDVNNQIDSIPGSGLGFQLLQLASEDNVLSEIFSKYENTDVIFNYIGQNENPLSRKFVENNVFGERCEHDIRNDAKRETKLLFMISIVNGNLLLDLQYSKNLHKKETVYKVAMDFVGELKAIISDVEKVNVHDINKLQEIE